VRIAIGGSTHPFKGGAALHTTQLAPPRVPAPVLRRQCDRLGLHLVASPGPTRPAGPALRQQPELVETPAG